jgi:general stress protein CsbA
MTKQTQRVIFQSIGLGWTSTVFKITSNVVNLTPGHWVSVGMTFSEAASRHGYT